MKTQGLLFKEQRKASSFLLQSLPPPVRVFLLFLLLLFFNFLFNATLPPLGTGDTCGVNATVTGA